MIEIHDGDIFATECDVIVCPVNCVGIMGKGLAKEFAQKYPEYYKRYSKACINRMIRPGRPVLHLFADLYDKDILSFPTKNHWKQSSNVEHIIEGLKVFSERYNKMSITSIAFPALGCGCGGLTWDEIYPVMKKYLDPLPIKCEIYKPQ